MPPPDRFFGLADSVTDANHGLTTGQFVDLARTAGATSIRTTLDWRAVEPRRDGWSSSTWRRFDEFYGRARAVGLTPMFTLAYAPNWARSLEGRLCLFGAASCLYPPRRGMDGEWAQFAAEAARRYPDAIFEIWNEPNLRGYWQSGPDPIRYAELQRAAYRAIKAVRPGTMVLTAGFANTQASLPLVRVAMKDFIERAYAAGLRGHMDALAFHPYPGPSSSEYSGPEPNLGPGSAFAQTFEAIRAVRDAWGDGDLPLFATEVGISTAHGVSRAEQATATRRLYNKLLSMDDVAGAVFYRIVEPMNYVVNASEVGLAWLRSGSGGPTPWPVYCAFVAAAGTGFPGC